MGAWLQDSESIRIGATFRSGYSVVGVKVQRMVDGLRCRKEGRLQIHETDKTARRVCSEFPLTAQMQLVTLEIWGKGLVWSFPPKLTRKGALSSLRNEEELKRGKEKAAY